jgi:hypothetical protein
MTALAPVTGKEFPASIHAMNDACSGKAPAWSSNRSKLCDNEPSQLRE